MWVVFFSASGLDVGVLLRRFSLEQGSGMRRSIVVVDHLLLRLHIAGGLYVAKDVSDVQGELLVFQQGWPLHRCLRTV